MLIDIASLFVTLPAENVPRHLPFGGIAYRCTWVDQVEADDWKADSLENNTTDAVAFIIASSVLFEYFWHFLYVAI